MLKQLLIVGFKKDYIACDYNQHPMFLIKKSIAGSSSGKSYFAHSKTMSAMVFCSLVKHIDSVVFYFAFQKWIHIAVVADYVDVATEEFFEV